MLWVTISVEIGEKVKIKYGIIVLIAGLFLLSTGGAVSALPYSYDSDNEGWQQSYIGRPAGGPAYDTLFSRTPSDWRSTNGNANGNIYQKAQGIDKRAYWMGYIGDNFLGDVTGMQLQTDIFSSTNWKTIANNRYGDDGNVYARWVIANDVGNGLYNMFVSTAAQSIDINKLSGWETHSIVMDEDNFFRWPNSIAGSQSFDELLTDYDSLGLYLFSGTDDINNINGGNGTWGDSNRLLHYGAYSSDGNEALWALDNFQAAPVPEPTTWLLFGIGLAGLSSLRIRKKKL